MCSYNHDQFTQSIDYRLNRHFHCPLLVRHSPQNEEMLIIEQLNPHNLVTKCSYFADI